jgi:hypothetical protein
MVRNVADKYAVQTDASLVQFEIYRSTMRKKRIALSQSYKMPPGIAYLMSVMLQLATMSTNCTHSPL